MAERKLSHRGARQKGKRLEHEITKSLKNIGIDAKRVPLSGALSWLKGDVTEFDTIKPHVHECKNCETLELHAWWKQSVDQAINGEVPVLHFTSNYKSVYTVLRVADFDELVESYERYRPELSLSLVTLPPRKNFWKYADVRHANRPAFLFTTKEEELIILQLPLYLLLRKYDIKRRADDVLAA